MLDAELAWWSREHFAFYRMLEPASWRLLWALGLAWGPNIVCFICKTSMHTHHHICISIHIMKKSWQTSRTHLDAIFKGALTCLRLEYSGSYGGCTEVEKVWLAGSRHLNRRWNSKEEQLKTGRDREGMSVQMWGNMQGVFSHCIVVDAYIWAICMYGGVDS